MTRYTMHVRLLVVFVQSVPIWREKGRSIIFLAAHRVHHPYQPYNSFYAAYDCPIPLIYDAKSVPISTCAPGPDVGAFFHSVDSAPGIHGNYPIQPATAIVGSLTSISVFSRSQAQVDAF